MSRCFPILSAPHRILIEDGGSNALPAVTYRLVRGATVIMLTPAFGLTEVEVVRALGLAMSSLHIPSGPAQLKLPSP
jgi:hypothetical protein